MPSWCAAMAPLPLPREFQGNSTGLERAQVARSLLCLGYSSSVSSPLESTAGLFHGMERAPDRKCRYSRDSDTGIAQLDLSFTCFLIILSKLC